LTAHQGSLNFVSKAACRDRTQSIAGLAARRRHSAGASRALTKGEGVRFWAPDGIGASDVVLTFVFLQWSSVTALNSVAPGGWSIAVEMQFYLLFPLIIYLFRRPNGPVFFYALVALVSAVAEFAAQRYLIPRLALSLPGNQAYLAEAFYYCWLPRQFVCFGLGVLLYRCIE
jgi:peptidoglycan/LPS O-acetylase OafA/YrhL